VWAQSAADLLLLEYIRGLDGAVQSKAITVDEDTCRIADWKRYVSNYFRVSPNACTSTAASPTMKYYELIFDQLKEALSS
jgi:hypothetical protein